MNTAPHLNAPEHRPYAAPWTNTLYNMLFCDRPQDLLQPGSEPAPWQAALCSERPDLRAAAAIAADRDAESRLRLLACHVLRSHGAAVPGRQLLGVVVEVGLDDGLDTLAAYADGSVRYLNHAGHVEMIEASDVAQPAIGPLFEASVQVVARIGAWDQARPSAPPAGQIRLNFLVTDGLYFGQGNLQVMQRDGMAGPIIDRATALLQLVIGLARKRAA